MAYYTVNEEKGFAVAGWNLQNLPDDFVSQAEEVMARTGESDADTQVLRKTAELTEICTLFENNDSPFPSCFYLAVLGKELPKHPKSQEKAFFQAGAARMQVGTPEQMKKLQQRVAKEGLDQKERTVTLIEKQKRPLNRRSFWVSYRCELAECARTDELRGCGGCGSVNYCCAAHQRRDWDRHKLDCRLLKSLDIKAIPFLIEEQLMRYPFGCFQATRHRTDKDLSASCDLCQRSALETPLALQGCCGGTLCVEAPPEGAVPSCAAAHRKSTCFFHFKKGHSGWDWRLCMDCRERRVGDQRDPFLQDSCEITPAVDVPRAQSLTAACISRKCENRVFVGDDSSKCIQCRSKKSTRMS